MAETYSVFENLSGGIFVEEQYKALNAAAPVTQKT